jgi:hypothetical protein
MLSMKFANFKGAVFDADSISLSPLAIIGKGLLVQTV